MPFLLVANTQHAVNQTVSGVRVLSKIVPAVTGVRWPQLVHMSRRSPSRHAPVLAQVEHVQPSGQRSHSM